MRLYHGSPVNFRSFDLKFAKGYKDFGRGIYLTTNKFQAKRRAVALTGSGYLYYCDIKDRALKDTEKYKIKMLLKYDEEWLRYIVRNRRRVNASDDYDIVYDRMADSNVKNLNDILLKYYLGKCSANYALKQIMFAPSKKYNQYCFKTHRILPELRIIKKTQVIERGGATYEV